MSHKTPDRQVLAINWKAVNCSTWHQCCVIADASTNRVTLITLMLPISSAPRKAIPGEACVGGEGNDAGHHVQPPDEVLAIHLMSPEHRVMMPVTYILRESEMSWVSLYMAPPLDYCKKFITATALPKNISQEDLLNSLISQVLLNSRWFESREDLGRFQRSNIWNRFLSAAWEPGILVQWKFWFPLLLNRMYENIIYIPILLGFFK